MEVDTRRHTQWRATPSRFSYLFPQDVQLPPTLLRRHLRLRIRVRDVDKLPDGDLTKRKYACPLCQLEAKIQAEEDGYVDVARDEGLGVPVARHEGSVAAGKQQQDEHQEREPGGIGLEGRLPGELVARDALAAASVIEAQVDGTDDGPGHEGGDRDKVL